VVSGSAKIFKSDGDARDHAGEQLGHNRVKIDGGAPLSDAAGQPASGRRINAAWRRVSRNTAANAEGSGSGDK
jgi:hypothetical protein